MKIVQEIKKLKKVKPLGFKKPRNKHNNIWKKICLGVKKKKH